MDKNRRIMEVGQPFEPRSGSTLVERPSLFCGVILKQSDAVALNCDIMFFA